MVKKKCYYCKFRGSIVRLDIDKRVPWCHCEHPSQEEKAKESPWNTWTCAWDDCWIDKFELRKESF